MGNVEKLGVLVIIILVVVILVLTVWGFTMPVDEFADDPGRSPELNSVDDNGNGTGGTGSPADQPRGSGSVLPLRENSGTTASPWPVRQSNPPPDPIRNPDPIREPDPLPDPDPVPDAPLVHIVKDGETPWSIAKHYLGDGNRFEEVLALNPGVTARNMSVGTKLKIPTNRARPAVRSPVVDSPPSGNLYVVKEGDSLWKIAKNLLGNGNASARILDANRDRLTGDGSNLYPGMTLKIPR